MSLLIFRALWGTTGTLAEKLERIAAAGYDGVEAWFHSFDVPPAEFRHLLDAHGLKLIMATSFTQPGEAEPALKAAAELGPLKINVHGGRDDMTRDEGAAFFEAALEAEARIGLPVGHETHRQRVLFTPWDTAYYLRQFPELKITADYSHWVNVCGRLPTDQAEALVLANARAAHIHGRVGYENGPQVPHPAAPEYAPQLAWHEDQWQAIRAHHGDATLTFTPEYGPPTYMPLLPFSNVPVADLWEVCLWGAQRARAILA